MNMISTGAFLNEMDASNKQETISEKFVAVWEKKNAKAARAGGVSLMALSLAACGSSSTTTTTTTSDTTTTTPAVDAAKTISLSDKLDNVTGGSGDDTIIGDNDTVDVADVIDGGAGTDTLKIYNSSTMSANISNVENIYVYGEGTIDVTDTGATSIELDKFTVNDTLTVDAGQSISLKNLTGAANDMVIATAATTTSHVVTVEKSGDSTNAVDLQFNGTGLTSVTLNAAGATHSYVDIDHAGTKAKTLTINATSDLTIEDIEVATTIDASGSTGKVTLTTAVDETTVTGGSGNDTVTLGMADITYEGTVNLGAGDDVLVLGANMDAATNLTDSKVTLNGGDGTDILEVDDALAAALGGLSAANLAKKGISGFETLRINSDVVNDAAGDINMANLQAFTTVEYEGAREDEHQLDNLVNNGTVKLTGADDDGKIIVTIKDAALAGHNSDTLNVVLNGAHALATTNFDYGALTANNIETINITSGTSKAATLTLTTADNELDLVAVNARTINIDGSVDIDLNGDALEDAVEVINASALTGELELSIVGANVGVEVTGSAVEVNTIVGSANADAIIGGAKADDITTSGGADILTGGGKSDTFTMTSAATGGTAVELVTIKDMKFGATASDGDVLEIDFDDIENQLDGIGGVTTHDLVDGDGTSVGVAASVVQTLSTTSTMGATASVFFLSGVDLADTDAVETALEVGGSRAITTGGTIEDDDGFVVIYTDGTDAYGAVATNVSGGNVVSTTFAATELQVNNFVKFEGVDDLSALVAANITFI